MTTPEANSLAAVVRDGDYRAKLEAIRDHLASSLEGASDRQLIHVAPLTKQLVDVLDRLNEIPNADAPADSVETAQAGLDAKLRLVQ